MRSLDIRSSLEAGSKRVHQDVPRGRLATEQGENTEAIKHLRRFGQRAFTEACPADQVAGSHLAEFVEGDLVQRGHRPQRDAGRPEHPRDAVMALPPSLLPGAEFTHDVGEPPELDHPLHRHSERQSANRDRFVGPALLSQSVFGGNEEVSVRAAHLSEPGTLHAPGHRPQQTRLLLGPSMHDRVLGEAVISGEVGVHDSTPRPPDMVGYALRHGGHQFLGLGHGKGEREANPRRETPHQWLHADTLSADAAGALLHCRGWTFHPVSTPRGLRGAIRGRGPPCLRVFVQFTAGRQLGQLTGHFDEPIAPLASFACSITQDEALQRNFNLLVQVLFHHAD